MVILFVAPYYEERGKIFKSGSNVYLRRVSGALKELGHTPIILSRGIRDLHYMENGIEIFFVRCPYLQLGAGKLELLFNMFHKSLVVNRKIAELVQERQIDIIQFLPVHGLSACYYGKTPAVIRLSIYSKVYKDYRDNKAEIAIKAFWERIAAKRCNAVFAPSNVIANAFSKDTHRKVSVIESPFWDEGGVCDDRVYRDKLFGKKYCLYFGRMSVDKGILVIADVLQRFLQLNPEYYFVCCGDAISVHGEDSIHVLRNAAGKYKGKFIYIKTIPHALLYPIVQHADFVIFPSLIDNLPNACIEAMHFGKVVIGTDGASFEQLIDDGENGLLCKPNEAESLLEKMNEAAVMSEARKAEIGKNARKRIDKLAPEFVVKKLLRFYRYVIENMMQR